jgi:hypothetical protein
MKVFVLGGYGKTGISAIQLLAESNLVSEIAVAGRNLERAEKFAAEVGEKAIAVRADGTNEQELTSLFAGYNMIVNAATNDAVLPSIRAAIHNRAHYCDMAWAGILEQAGQLGPEAEVAGIAAIIATGISPCISNLMGVHAAHQLDEVQQLQIGRADIFNFQSGRELSPRQWLEDPNESLTALQEFRSFIGWLLQRVQDDGVRRVLIYQNGGWVEVNPLKSGLEVPLAQGGRTTSRPYMSGDDFWGMLPGFPYKVKPVEMSFSPFPPQLGAVLQELALGVLEEKIDAEAAISTFYDTIQGDPHRWLTPPDDYVAPAKLWINALGRKDDQASRCSCWFTAPMWDVNGYFLTSVALVAAVLKVLRGEIKTRGVIMAEKAFEPLSFLDETAALMPDLLPKGEIIAESFEWLE